MPDLKDGMKIRYSLVARREQNKRRKKREEDPNNRKYPYLEPVKIVEKLREYFQGPPLTVLRVAIIENILTTCPYC